MSRFTSPLASHFTALMYHNLERQPRDEYALEPRDFEAQLSWLASEGFVAEGFPELTERLSAPGPWPARYCVLTFDDGHESNLQAAEMVRRAGFQATFFITRHISLPHFLDDEGVRELSAICSVGSHGVTHRALIKLPTAEVKRELSESRQWLEDVTGAPVPWFSAPGGAIDRRVRRLAVGAGYALIGNSVEGWNRAAAVASRQLVNRVMIYRSYDARVFSRIVRLDRWFLLRRRLRSAAVLAAKHLLSERAVLRVSRWKRQLRRAAVGRPGP